MKFVLVVVLALSIGIFSVSEVFGEKNTFFESVKFIQYLDENTALEEVRNGNLDIYYYRISSDRVESPDARKGLQVFDSAGGSYSILVNPAEAEKFNPFTIKEVRYSLNYLVDRKLIVNELMGGYGTPMISYYGPSDPEYLTIIEELEKFNFRYNPILAEEIISNALSENGAKKIDGKWSFEGVPIEITIFIRSDDPVRKSIGEILASELEKIGFTVKKEFGDLNKAFVIVYGTNPAELKWSLYIEGWSRSAFVRYDSVGLGQMYSPWFSYMPGFNDPTYWNYKNEKIDSLTQRIYTGDFESSIERSSLIKEAVVEGINESVRIFLASKIDQYVVNQNISGIVNDFGAGVPSRFTPINARGSNDELVIGVKQIYQGSWNPVMGFSDSYSRHIWDIVSDPVSFKHPFSGKTFPVRAEWIVKTAGPHEKIDVPEDAVIWDPQTQKWEKVGPNTKSISKVTFDFEFSKWHNQQMMDMNDILYSLYFTMEWGTQANENDKTFDSEFTPRANQAAQTIVGINPIDENTIEVFVDYWHFDEGEIADWAALWSTTPWEISAAMEKAVLDGKVSYSRSGATNKNINWISLIIPKDSRLIQEYLEDFRKTNYLPNMFQGLDVNQKYVDSRYESSIKWIEEHNHAVISNGPFFLKSYSPESRTITVESFDDETYPFKEGHWSEFENADIPKISHVEIPKIISKNSDTSIQVSTADADSILYFLSNGRGEVIRSGTIDVKSNNAEINFKQETINELDLGANTLKIFAISNEVLKPDRYTTSFFVTQDSETLPKIEKIKTDVDSYNNNQIVWIVIPIIIAILALIIRKRRSI